MGKKISKISNGGVYHVDYKEFKLPEWGNNKNNSLHKCIAIKTTSYAGKELYISIPMTSNAKGIKNKKEVIELLFSNGIKSYALINHIRVIAKWRFKSKWKINEEHVHISLKQANEIEKGINDYFFVKFNSLKESIDTHNKQRLSNYVDLVVSEDE